MKDFLRKRIVRKLLYLLILGINFSIFLSLVVLNINVKKEIAEGEILLSPLSFVSSDYPIIENSFISEISAQGAAVIDIASQIKLYEKNSNFRFPPASTTKIMTALVALENYNPDDILTIFQTNVEGEALGFSIGEKFTFENLLYAMMLPSSNEAALSIAQNFPGGEKAFVEEMNKKAQELSLPNTRYEEPVGLLDEQDYTSPIDLAKLTSVALKNPLFAEVVSTQEKIIKNTKGKEYKIGNLNILLDIPGVVGVKTGTTPGAGQVLVTSKKLEGRDKELIFVVMQSLDRFGDTKALIDYSAGINYLSIHP